MRTINEVGNYYKQLSRDQRIQIKTLIDQGKTQQYIALYIGCSQSAISRELKRNTIEDAKGREIYKPDKAHILYEDRRKKANLQHNFYIKHKELPGLIEKLLDQQYSPDIICQRILKEETNFVLSTSTLYNYIRDKKPNWRKKLTFKFGYKKHNKIKKPKICPELPRIHERDQAIEERDTIGHRELDSVVSIGHRGGLTTLTERMSRYVLIKKAARLTAEQTLYNVVEMLEGHCVYTLTTDNGSEMALLDIIAQRLLCKCYLCDPYSSWQKASNEKNNREIRIDGPKGTDFDTYTNEQILAIQNRINKKPRKILGYKSAYEVYYNTTLTYLR